MSDHLPSAIIKSSSENFDSWRVNFFYLFLYSRILIIDPYAAQTGNGVEIFKGFGIGFGSSVFMVP